ncbi:protein kinase domain-containing protein [Dysosmobacter sp.]|uniref:protein kinase domain-containing protein n=1 Tax=Dysosmobacter sp. TaxID=2591382 RepID=UPI003AEF7CEF
MAERKDLCYNCFQEKPEGEGPCPYCGFDLAENEKKFPVALRAGTVLNGRYIVGRVLGQGGFGITYLALDTQLNAKVAIKEFMPGEIATRQGTTVSVMMDTKSEEFAYGAERFQEEARTLAKFIGNPNIAAVTSYFDENDTSYFVMDYIEGISFKTYIANHGGKISVEETLNVMIPVLRALTAVHAEGFIHRDVTPDNIYITKDGMVKLLDFGSARYSIGDKSKSLDVILKVGYAPKEQYIRRSRQGPFTDVYSCAACFYAAITGFLPPESLERMDEDTLVPISQCGIDIPEYLDKAILKGLAVQPEDRFQNAQEFLDAIESRQVVEVPVSGGAAPASAPEKKKVKPVLIAGIAALVVAVAVGVGIAIGGGGKTAVDADGEEIQLVEAEVPSITIQGQEYGTDLTELNLASLYLTDADIEQLKYMVNLRELDLPASSEITDLSPLAGLTQLQVLRMNDGNSVCSVMDLTPLSSLTNLVNLQLSCMAEDLSPLAGLTNLKALSLHLPISVDDISFLTNLTNLQSLHIQDNGSNNAHIVLDDLTPLSGLTQLQELGLSVNGITDFDWASDLTELRSLSCWGSEATYTDLDGLKNLTKLQTLVLPYPNIVGNPDLDPEPYDIQGLSGLTELVYLQMYAGVKDLTPLQNLTKLQTLYIYNGTTKPSDTSLEPVRNLTELREFYFYAYGENVSVDLSPLDGLTKLQVLSITAQGYYDSPYPSVINLSALENLQDLRTLELNFTNVSDISPLRDLKNLQSVAIYSGGHTTVSDWSPVDHVPNVTKG